MPTRRMTLGMIAMLPACNMKDGKEGIGEPSRIVPLNDPDVRIIENTWIPMVDGARLAARLFLPADAEARPAGAVLEYLPYRKRDSYRARDDVAGPILAKGGIALVRVDIRGTGDSDGVMSDEYSPAEQADALQVIAWIAKQPWCNGCVGMRGISYGAFNGYQMAGAAPPALKSIVAACGSERRFTDDVHYLGGCLLHDQLLWGVFWSALMRLPPDPEIAGADPWRAQWRARLEGAAPITASWIRHQREDAFWRQGSVPPEKIHIPVLHAGGMLDGYVNAIPRLLATAPAEQRAVIGPWAHQWPGYPDGPSKFGKPGPGVDWLPLEIRWWRHHLLGERNGVMESPRLWAFRHDLTGAATYPADSIGAWVPDNGRPTRFRTLFLNADGLGHEAAPKASRQHRTDLAIGFTRPGWFPVDVPGALWREQSEDDARSLTFDSPPLTEPLDIVGQPVFRLRVAADRPVAKVVARLCEVTADGRSHFVSHGVLNLTHRDDHAAPAPLEPGRAYDVAITGLFAAYRFSTGARVRVAISETWWPVLWPSPDLVTLTILTGVSRLDLPRWSGSDIKSPFALLRNRWSDDRIDERQYMAGGLASVEVTGKVGSRTFKKVEDSPAQAVPIAGANISEAAGLRIERTITEGDPNSAVMRVTSSFRYMRDGFDTFVEASGVLRSTATHFLVDETLTARDAGKTIFERKWSERIPRDLI